MRSLSIKKIGLIILACVLLLSLKNCDFRLMTKWEVEENLKKRYGQEFTVLSSASVTEDYYDDNVWRVRLYVVSPKDDPEMQFFAFNTVEGENFGGCLCGRARGSFHRIGWKAIRSADAARGTRRQLFRRGHAPL